MLRLPKNPSLDAEVRSALSWLKSHSTKATRDGMARYAIPSDNAYGVAMKDMKALGKKLGRNHELAAALWDTGVYEARMVCSFVDDPAQVTSAQMDRWCKDFDNWAICDTICFNLFDRTPHAWAKVGKWSSVASSKSAPPLRSSGASRCMTARHQRAVCSRPRPHRRRRR